MIRRLAFCLLLVILINVVLSENKYSKEANVKKKTSDVDFRTLDKPFRMAKLNLLWTKAQHRLTEPKLKSLYSDLMIQDKEELTHKRVKSEGGDKEGLKEADLRKKLSNIIGVYGLREHFDGSAPTKHKEHPAYNSAIDDHINRSLFKDKKLSMLWSKAEKSGFTSDELKALKEEFYHHQDKIDQYYDLLDEADKGKQDQYQNAVNDEEMLETNEINKPDEGKKDYLDRANLIRDKHRGLRDGYDKLERLTARGRNNKEFVEPKVQGLWVMATQSNFTTDELASLKVELHHYETRLLKLRHLQADHVSNIDKYTDKVASAGDKMDMFAEQQQMIKKHTRKVEKLHADLENKILERHSEL